MSDHRLPESREPWRAQHRAPAAAMRPPSWRNPSVNQDVRDDDDSSEFDARGADRRSGGAPHRSRAAETDGDLQQDARQWPQRGSSQLPERPAVRAHPPRSAPQRLAEYVSENRSSYILWDIANSAEREIAKHRAVPDAFPAPPKHPLPGSQILRISTVALIAALLGGAPGIILGFIGALTACVRLANLGGRVRKWRRSAEYDDDSRQLPSAATSERLRLLTGLGQSLIAVGAGSAILLLLMLR